MSKNPITGDEIATKAVNDLYRDGFDRIFGKSRILRFETEEIEADKEPGNTGSSVLEEGKDDLRD